MVDEHDHETAPTAPYPGFFFPHHLNIDMLRMHIIGNVKTHLNLPLFFPLIVLVRFDVWRKAFRGRPTSLMYLMLEGEALEDSEYEKVSKPSFVSRSHMLDHHAKLVSHQQSQLPT